VITKTCSAGCLRAVAERKGYVMDDVRLLEEFAPVNQRLIEQGLLSESTPNEGKPFDEVTAPTEWLPCAEFRLEADVNQLFALASEDPHPWYTDESPSGYQLAVPVALLKLGTKAVHRQFVVKLPPGQSNLNAKVSCEFLAPVKVGEVYREEGRLAETYVRRGRRYQVYEGRFLDKDGNVVQRFRQTRMVGKVEEE
jgi:hypothetical protein